MSTEAFWSAYPKSIPNLERLQLGTAQPPRRERGKVDEFHAQEYMMCGLFMPWVFSSISYWKS